ncbi:MAG TPA: class I SAM-dependent methyltransferase [Stellaceae bacterium]|nr:class I SAM-dependent methyltransferase [Stellaceae bacterium]
MALDERPLEYRQIWEGKPVLRALYADYYRMIRDRCRPGRTLEIGGGSGNFKSFAADVVSTDILFAPWLDAVADAQRLPFVAGSFDNLVLFDVLHHIEAPLLFLREAERVLRPGGRLIMVEPAITPASGFFYRHFHPEPVVMAADPLAVGESDARRDAFDANQAIPTLLCWRDRDRLAQTVPGLRLVERRRIALFAYPLSGGFRPWSALPAAVVAPVLSVERWLEPILGPLMAFRLIATFERLTPDTAAG